MKLQLKLKLRLAVVVVAILLGLLMGVFPPWRVEATSTHGNRRARLPRRTRNERPERQRRQRRSMRTRVSAESTVKSGPYALLWSPPDDAAVLDIGRVGLQWILIAGVAGGLCFILRHRPQDD